MHVVQVSTNGVAVGTIRFQGIVPAAEKSIERRLYKCSPKGCVPPGIVRKIADGLASGNSAGNEDVYAWRG